MTKAKQPVKKLAAIKSSRKPINNLILIGDTHIGDSLGLCHKDGARLDDGGHYLPNRLQKIVWNWWEEYWGEWVPFVTKGEPFAVVHMGDVIDYSHHHSTSIFSHNINDQMRAAYDIMHPVVELCEGRYYHLRGTEAHSGPSSVEEERLAHSLGAKPNQDGQYARYDLWLQVGSGLVNLMHHIGTCGSMASESTAVLRELTEAYQEAARWGTRPPDILARAHRHRNIEVRIITQNGFATAFTTPAWQLKTSYAWKIAGARQSTPQIGGSLIRSGDSDNYTRHRIWNIERTKEEII